MKDLPSVEQVTLARVAGDKVKATLMPSVMDPARVLKFIKPMHLKKRAQGKFKINSCIESVWQVATFRHAIFFGVKPTKIKFDTPVEFHTLVGPNEDGATPGILTSDMPQEIYSQYIEFKKCHGNVLVGGLGLGMAAQMLLDVKKVTSVTVVEKSKDIIKLMRDQIDPRIKVIHADLYEFLKQPLTYDSVYYDIWYGTGESTWAEQVVPLYRLSRKAGIKGALTAWGETEMYAQFIPALYANNLMQYDHPWKPYKVFYEAVREKYGVPTHKQLQSAIKLYLMKVGSPKWEKMFNWDKWERKDDSSENRAENSARAGTG